MYTVTTSWTERDRQQRRIRNVCDGGSIFHRLRLSVGLLESCGLLCAVRYWNVKLLFPLSLFTLVHTVSLTEILLLSLPFRRSSAAYIDIHAKCRLPRNTCKALGGSCTSNSMHSCIAGRSTRGKRRPAGRKDVGYEIYCFYLARRHQWRANGTAQLKSFAEKGPNIKRNHRNGTHSSHSNCSLYCGSPSGLFQFERHSSYKKPCTCTCTDHMETRTTTWTLGNY